VVTNTATASFWLRAKRQPVPLVYFCHGLHWSHNSFDLATQPWKLAETWALRHTSAVICMNSDDETWFIRHGHRPMRLVNGVGVPLQKFPFLPLPDFTEPLRLVWIGELYPRKRPSLASDVLRELRTQHINATLTMYGSGELTAPMIHYAQSCGLTTAVTLPGPTTDVAGALAHAHALLHTASWEGLPRVGLEALAVGRRTFAFDSKGVRDIPQAGLAPDADPSALARIIAAGWTQHTLQIQPPDRTKLSSQHAARPALQAITSTLH